MSQALDTIPRQPSLLDCGIPPGHDGAFTTATRLDLADGAWVDLCRGWASGHEALFDAVLAAADWQTWRRPMYDRMVDTPRLSVNWGTQTLPPGLDAIAAMADSLSHRYDAELTRVSANLYRDGQDSVAWHGDTHLRDRDTALVAVLSLGSRRAFKLRPRQGGAALSWDVGHGDLMVMGGTCQRTWQHAVPKTAVAAGPRICVMFRTDDIDGLDGRDRWPSGT